ncbi:MAG: hypothetical protein D6755_01195 [Anaerolineae bacterium]|nr:MAG: hypothetical protein D6755_01195 [Anaerolineae bacterium]
MKQNFHPLLLLGAIVLIIGMACNLGGSPPPTPTLEPTQPPPPTNTPLPTDTPVPTDTPAPTETSPPPPTEDMSSSQSQPAPFTLDSTTTTYADGVYEVYAPTGWAADEGTAAVSFAEPDGGANGFIYLQATNTGYELDFASFQRFVEAREANFFGSYDNYQQTTSKFNEEKSLAFVAKTLDFNGIPQVVETHYDQKGQIIYAIDFWVDADAYDAYVPVYDEFFSGITVDSKKAAQANVYNWVWTFTGPADLFTIKIPTAWRYEHDANDTTAVDTFYSPDEHAIVQNVAYDDGTAISKSEAGAFALSLLRNFYADDVKITGDKVQPDGSERLTWSSPSGEYSGVSFFESRGTTFLLFTVMYDDAYQDTYLDTLDYIISTYDVP